jgi:hypothetical protein
VSNPVSLVLGLPVSRTQSVSSGVMCKACTLINVVLEALPNGMPLTIVERPPGGVFRAKLGYAVSAVLFVTSPRVYACASCVAHEYATLF